MLETAILAAATVTPAEKTLAQQLLSQIQHFLTMGGVLYAAHWKDAWGLFVAGVFVFMFGSILPADRTKQKISSVWPFKFEVLGNARTIGQAAGLMIVLVSLVWIAHDHNLLPSLALSSH